MGCSDPYSDDPPPTAVETKEAEEALAAHVELPPLVPIPTCDGAPDNQGRRTHTRALGCRECFPVATTSVRPLRRCRRHDREACTACWPGQTP